MGGGGEVFYNLTIKSKYFNRPVSLSCELHKLDNCPSTYKPI